MRIAEFLRAWRTEEKLTLTDAAERLGVPFYTIHKLEKGSGPNGDTLAAILRYMLSE